MLFRSEVIVLPAFMASVAAYGYAHAQGLSCAVWIALAGVLLCIALFVCTSMIYICLKFLQEWHTPLTLVNFVLLGSASGALLAAALASAAWPKIAACLAVAAGVMTAAGALTRSMALARNALLRPKSTVQSATGIANLTGFPDLIVPAGFTTDDLPVTVSFFGPAFSEPKLLALGYSFEQITHARRRPVNTPALNDATVSLLGAE